MSHVLALDLGCTKAIIAIANEAGEILARKQIETLVDDGSQQAVDRICDAFEELAAHLGVETSSAHALGIGAPGPLDRHNGILNNPPQMPWGDVPLVAMLSRRLGSIPSVIDNDCKVGGVGEWKVGAASGAENVVYFGVGTGIGGCVIIDGQVQYGKSDNASEIGHLVVWMDGPECGCGSRGCLEGIASGSGVERRFQAAFDVGALTSLPRNIRGGDIVAAAESGEELCQQLWRDAKYALAAACAGMMSTLSPEVIVIGGGFAARNGQPYVDEVERFAREMAFGPNKTKTRIVAAELGEDSVLHGAIAMAQTLQSTRL